MRLSLRRRPIPALRTRSVGTRPCPADRTCGLYDGYPVKILGKGPAVVTEGGELGRIKGAAAVGEGPFADVRKVMNFSTRRWRVGQRGATPRRQV